MLRPAAHPTRHYLLTGHTVFAFEGGRTLWHHPLPAFKTSLPTMLLVEDHLYVAAGSVYALDKETGTILWQRPISLVTALFTQEQLATSLFWQQGRLCVETTRNGSCGLTHRQEPSSGSMQKPKLRSRHLLSQREGT